MTASWIRRLRCIENPVLAKDLRTRMRGAKAFVIQGGFVAILALMMGIAYFSWWVSHRAMSSPMVASDLGKMLYLLVFQTQAAMVLLITPALTAGAITIEHEQRTFELLACSRISPRSVIVGKLVSGWMFVVMLLTCSLPLAALSFMMGGISGGQLASSYAVLVVMSLFVAAVGIVASAITARSAQAVMLTYAIVFAYCLGTVFGLDFSGAVAALNPFVLIAETDLRATLLSRDVPAWLPLVTLLPLLSLLLGNWAIARLPHFRANRMLAVRALLIPLVVMVTVYAVGFRASGIGYAMSRTEPVAAMLAGSASALALLAIPLVSGGLPAHRPRSLIGWLATGINPRRLFPADMRGGWSFMLLLTLVFLATLAIVSMWSSISHSPPSSPMPSIWSRSHAAALPFLLTSTQLWQAFLVIGSVILAYAGLGAIGAAFNSARSGIAMGLILWISSLVLPTTVLASRSLAGPGPRLPTDYSIYLFPYVGLWKLTTPMTLPGGLGDPSAPPVWVVTTALYLGLAAAAFVTAEIVHQIRRPKAVPAPVVAASPAGGD